VIRCPTIRPLVDAGDHTQVQLLHQILDQKYLIVQRTMPLQISRQIHPSL